MELIMVSVYTECSKGQEDVLTCKGYKRMLPLVKPFYPPDSPSRHHLPFDRLTALSKAEGRRCLRSLLLAAYYPIRLSPPSSAPYI